MKRYNFVNNLVGWGVFLVAAVVYFMTMAPTASFWDCGEFIAAASKLEVNHPPGAPFFLLIGRVFSMFASEPSEIAKMVNSVSALASAFTILFLFWTITYLAKKIIVKSEELSLGQGIAVIGSGLVGALAYTFSDTFWFSAVEAEVYGTSSLFSALVFWSILKWESESAKSMSNRWLLLIAYLMGLSIGVHLLNLLAIPAIVFVYYFKKNPVVTRKGVIKAAVVSLALLGGIMYVVIPMVIIFAKGFDLLFVNSFNLPVNSGVVFYLVILTGTLGYFIVDSHKKGKPVLNAILLSITFILIGYSSYSMVVVRSSAEPPMNQNTPDNIFVLHSYINREQYGDRPLFSGQTYNAPLIDQKDGKAVYSEVNGEYKITSHKVKNIYPDEMTTLFPRMYSSQPHHIKDYKQWANVKGRPVTITVGGEKKKFYVPTFGENLKFFFKYQVGHMYLRYFMWNFAGRQNDIQGHGEITNGNWISGIDFIDEARLGSQDKLTSEMKNNKARNKYYLLPLLLGLAGIFIQYKKANKDFWVIMLLFLMTGLAIVVYLNQYPHQPRERDYAFAGSFYAYAIWIGLGVVAIYELLKKYTGQIVGAVIATVVSFVLVPSVMAVENWDDHDRSERYAARDIGSNYLNSCEENAIIFTNGDNDTFPLWYCQEVEGIRTDMRVVNLSYLGGSWYIDQMHKKAYKSESLPLNLTPDKYRQGVRDAVFIDSRIKSFIDLKEAMDLVASDNKATKVRVQSGESYDFIPSEKLSISVDTANILKNKILREDQLHKMQPSLDWVLKKKIVYKNDMMVLDLLANNNWTRPMYFAITVPNTSYLNLSDYFMSSGLAYKITPIKTTNSRYGIGSIDSESMYENMMTKFKFGNIKNADVYSDENIRRMGRNFRSNFLILALTLDDEGKADSAVKVIKKSLEEIPSHKIPYKQLGIPMAELLYKHNESELADVILEEVLANSAEDIDFYFSLGDRRMKPFEQDLNFSLRMLNEVLNLADREGKTEISAKASKLFNAQVSRFSTIRR